jgi:hypothetical protein
VAAAHRTATLSFLSAIPDGAGCAGPLPSGDDRELALDAVEYV